MDRRCPDYFEVSCSQKAISHINSAISVITECGLLKGQSEDVLCGGDYIGVHCCWGDYPGNHHRGVSTDTTITETHFIPNFLSKLNIIMKYIHFYIFEL